MSTGGGKGGGTLGSSSPQQSVQLDYEQRRGKVILEMYETEQVYQRLLAEFIDVFLRELESGDNEQARAFMSRPNLAGLCSNIEQISHLSQQLRGELHRVLDDAGAFDASAPPALISRRAARTAIGPIFKRFASLLQLYEQYVENHGFAIKDLQEFLAKPAFQLFWKKCADDARNARYEAQMELQNGGSGTSSTGNSSVRLKKQSSADYAQNMNALMSATSLDGYLILPIQRVPRYVMLLKELHRLTEKIGRDDLSLGGSSGASPPGSPGQGDSPKTQARLLKHRLSGGSGLGKFYQDELLEIQHGFKLVSDAADRMNEAMRGSETSQKMHALQSKFKGESVDLVGAGRGSRTLVREGELMRVTQKSQRHKAFHFHLLSDMIIYSEHSTNGTLKMHRMIPLDVSCKVFSSIPKPSGAQYEQYGMSANKSGGDERRRSSSIRLRRRTSDSPHISGASTPGTSAGGDAGAVREGETSDSAGHQQSPSTPASPQSGANRAFRVATPLKTITMYASTMAEKEAWVKDIKNVIRELARKQNPNAPPSNSTLFSAEDNALDCQICGTPFTLLKRKHHCKRCGVLTCSDCCARKRMFASKSTPQRCCDVCRLEMDLTARDDQPFRFRIFVQIRSVTGLGPLAKGEDRKDPLSRCYFALTQRSTKDGPGMRRGPTSVGHEASFMIPVGPRAEEDDSPYWVLRVYLLSVGEVGTVTFDVRHLMCAREMVFKRKVNVSFPLRGPLVDELCESPPTIALGFELLMPPALWITPDMEHDIMKLMQANKKHFEMSGAGGAQEAGTATGEGGSGLLDVKPRASSTASRIGLTDDEGETTSRRGSSARARTNDGIDEEGTFSLKSGSASGTAGAVKSGGLLDEEEDEEEAEEIAKTKFTVPARLRRFEGEDEESDVDEDEDGGGMVRSSNGGLEFAPASNPSRLTRELSADSATLGSYHRGKRKAMTRPRGRLNVHVYTMYERIAKERPSHWTVVCVKYLYIDTALRLANDETASAILDRNADVSKDALASLQERFLRFDNNPTIRKAWESVEDETAAPGGPSPRSSAQISSSGSKVTSAAVGASGLGDQRMTSARRSGLNNLPSKNPTSNFISQRALQYFDQLALPPKLASGGGELGKESTKRPYGDQQLSFHTGPGSSLTTKRRPGLEESRQGSTFGVSQLIINESGEEVHPRCLVLADLLRTEKAYIDALEVLDEVFITPLMQVAHGASAQTVKQGVQAARGTGGGTSSIHLGGGNIPAKIANTGPLMSLRARRDANESKAVANAVKQPDVTVLLQSVRQILTINKQLLRDLTLRLSTIDYSKCIGDIFCRFAVVLKVYNAFATNHPSVEKILTPRDVPIFTRRTSANLDKNGTNGSGSPASQTMGGSPGSVSSPGSGSGSGMNGSEHDDGGEGPCESLINFVKVLEEDERCDGRKFVQLLRLPKERLNRYKRILTSLLMHTPDDHNDAELLRSSLKLLDQSEKHISWSLRRRFNLEKLQDIQKSFSKVLPFAKQAPALVSARRWFKKEGYLVKRCRRDDRLVRFWLFNDALVYGVRVSGVTKSAPSFRFSRFLMLKDMTVHDLAGGVDRRTSSDVNQELGDNRFAFEIRSPEKSFIVMIPHILYDKPYTPLPLVDGKVNGTTGSSSPPMAAMQYGSTGNPTNAVRDNGVNELASDETKKKIKDDWLREILQCIHDIHEDDESFTPDVSRGAGETTDSLFKKTASHNKKIDAKAAPVWVHDQASNTCSQCPNKFTLTFRRHHCRSCGALVCEACSKARMVLDNIHPTKKQRVCKRCVAEIMEEEEGRGASAANQ